MSNLDNRSLSPSERPTSNVHHAWRAYWQAQNQPWRTETEIGKLRQEELATCRATLPDVDKNIYPFKGKKLTRADVEWMLATHDDGCGPVHWTNADQWKLKGLDLRGADLQN